MNHNTIMRLCTIENCGKKQKSRGYCSMHYERYRKTGDPLQVVWVVEHGKYASCIVEGCEREHSCKGYCTVHYARRQRTGCAETEVRVIGEGCLVEGCEGDYSTRGYCAKHAQRVARGGCPHTVTIEYNKYPHCTVGGCVERHFGKGLCEMHYNRSPYEAANRQRRRARIMNSPINDFTKEDWDKALKAFRGECSYCGVVAKLEQEHIIPVSRNGSNAKHNIVPACRQCNASKSNNYFESWYPKQPFYNRERETKIMKWLGCKVHKNKIQMNLF